MAKRRMLGSIEDPSVQGLMRVIETQRKETLAAWALASVEETCLPILARHEYSDERVTAAVAAAHALLEGAMTLRAAWPALNEARKAAQEAEEPIVQAALRAVAVASAVYSTPTNALGFTFYQAAAVAYDSAADMTDAAACDALAAAELARLEQRLRACAVADEPDPVKIDWGC